jgi:hypothetical protein
MLRDLMPYVCVKAVATLAVLAAYSIASTASAAPIKPVTAGVGVQDSPAPLTVAKSPSEVEQVQSMISVRVDNQARVPQGILSSALGEAARIFAEAGVRPVWCNCSQSRQSPTVAVCLETIGPLVLELTIVSQSDALSHRYSSDLFGLALPFRDGAIRSTVFYRPTIEAATRGPISISTLLGHIMAHELGHLLLWSNVHSAIGVMHGNWTREDLVFIAQGHVAFTPKEAETMKANILIRTKQAALLQPGKP